MGYGISREARTLFRREKKWELTQIKKKYPNREDRSILLVGPPQAGKTQLFRILTDHPFESSYEADEHARFGFKIMTTIKSKQDGLLPQVMHVTDSPGSLIRNERATDYFFDKCEVVLILIDISLTLDESKID